MRLLFILLLTGSTLLAADPNFVIYSTTKAEIGERGRIRGPIGSNGTLEARSEDSLYGNLLAGSILLRERTQVLGDAKSRGTITTLTGVVISGSKQENVQITFPDLPQINITPGPQNITVPSDGIYILNPGDYGNFQCFHRANLTIKPGSYTFNKFIVESDVKIRLDGGPINVNVKEQMRISDRVIMRFSGIVSPYSIHWYSAQTSILTLGYEDSLYGVVVAPNAEVRLCSRTKMAGALIGKYVVIESEGYLCKPPVMANLTHSETVMGPAFDPTCFSYRMSLPTTLNTIMVTPQGLPGQIITVDGQAPGSLINLNGTEQKILVLLSDPKNCGSTEYALNITRDDQSIHVNPNSQGIEDGKTFATGYKDLQKALDSAAVLGQPVLVTEGVYKPTKKTDASDPKSATFLLTGGTKIIGGFLGTETGNTPEGDASKTILSGDLAGNDGTNWPVDTNLLTDNAHHVVTINSPTPTNMVSMENITIEGGNGENGAGILNKNCSPTLTGCVIRHNRAISGGGIYDEGGINLIECEIRDNVAGSGAGIFLSNPTITATISSTVFAGNNSTDTAAEKGGTIYNAGAIVKIQTTLFTQNLGGSILTKSGGNIAMTNCTVAYGSGIASYSSTVFAINSIFWNPAIATELVGSGYTITHSCARGGYSGEANIDSCPKFRDGSDPLGPDGYYGTDDDGLQLLEDSPCIEAADTDSLPKFDLRLIPRPYNELGCMGVYEFEKYDANQRASGPFGYLTKEGYFYSEPRTDIISEIYNVKELRVYAASNFARVLQVNVPRNRYTERTTEFNIILRGLDNAGQPLAGSIGIPVRMIRTEVYSGSYVFQSKTLTWGKPIIFCKEKRWQNYNNPYAYIVYAENFGVSYDGSSVLQK